MDVHFLGILANVDSTIPKVKLDYGFKIEAVTKEEGWEICSSLEGITKWQAAKQMLTDTYVNNGYIFLIKKSFRYEKDILSPVGMLMEFTTKYHEYLENTLKLMLLFKEGGICMPKQYFYHDEKLIMSSAKQPNVSGPKKYTLSNLEIIKLNIFFKKTKIPFNKSFIQLAFEAYMRSYGFSGQNLALSFILLVTCLEILFVDDRHVRGKKQIIANRASILIGGSTNDKRKTRKRIELLYNKRTDIIHDGNFRAASNSDHEDIRHYVRECIKRASATDLNKDKLIEKLDNLIKKRGADNV